MIRIAILKPGRDEPFPPVEQALAEPNGLLAAGGDLSPRRLLDAYRHGIFPWFGDDSPILWWSPDPRTVFDTAGVHRATRLRRWLRRCDWQLKADHAFERVLDACAAPRTDQAGTWITPEMHAAYARLHALGYAHSVEVYDGAALVGGIYGVAIGRMFFGESMFSAATNGSKVALLALCRALDGWGYPLLDAQVDSPHLATLGARAMPRQTFVEAVARLSAQADATGTWAARWPDTLKHARALAD